MISVIIPTYNRGKIIERAIYSALNQTYKDLEVIVVDDGSTDDTESIVKRIEDSRVIYVFQTHRNGNVARNRGIEIAKGEYIGLLDSDDTWELDKMELQLEILLRENVDVVFCDLLKHSMNTDNTSIVGYTYNPGIVDYRTLVKDAVFPATVLAKREVFVNNRFDEDLKRMQGYEWQIRAGKTIHFIISIKHCTIIIFRMIQLYSLEERNCWKRLSTYLTKPKTINILKTMIILNCI